MNKRLLWANSIFSTLTIITSTIALNACSQQTSVSHQVTTTVPTVTPTIAVLQPNPAQGWVAAIPYGKSIAFANIQPLVGYACGNTTTQVGVGHSDNTTVIQYGITHNGGLTWSNPQQLLDAWGATCYISINPKDNADIVIGTESCPHIGCDTVEKLYRSRDGGQTWKQLTLPEDEYLTNPIWNGQDLFVRPGGRPYDPNASSPPSFAAVSHNGGDLKWVNDTNLPSIPNYDTGPVTVLHGILYVSFYSHKDSTISVFSTSDEGQHWSATQWPCSGTYLWIATDGKTLICDQQVSQTLTDAISVDDGKTWQSTPYRILASTPDETLYGVLDYNIGSFDPQPEGNLFSLVPGSSQWVNVLTLPSLTYLRAVSVTVQGHPVALWGSDDTGKPGISYHAA
jgi:BNR/Asp-box repeat